MNKVHFSFYGRCSVNSTHPFGVLPFCFVLAYFEISSLVWWFKMSSIYGKKTEFETQPKHITGSSVEIWNSVGLLTYIYWFIPFTFSCNKTVIRQKFVNHLCSWSCSPKDISKWHVCSSVVAMVVQQKREKIIIPIKTTLLESCLESWHWL